MPLILLVDDEPNILSALCRLFRNENFKILIADSGAAGLELLAQHPVDLVISDMRMPVMSGAQFLEEVRIWWPDTVRLLLTGHADIATILDAINRGEIYRYITKPWDDNDILLTVRHALEHKLLEQERRRLEALTLLQNSELVMLNDSLATKVRERTAELEQARDNLVELNTELKTHFLLSIKVFSNLIEMRGGNLAGHSLRVADLARQLAVQLGCDDTTTKDIYLAAMMHDIGKIGLTDDMLKLPRAVMSREQSSEYRKYPIQGEQLLMPLTELRGAAKLVRAQQERFDGSGYPDGLNGHDIPLGARILALVSDYDNLQTGQIYPRKIWPDEAREMLLQDHGKQYDPQLVTALFRMLDSLAGNAETARNAIQIPAATVQPGVTLAQDLVLPNGSLLLAAGHFIDRSMCRQIIAFDKTLAQPLLLSIYADA
ncbi:HD domain-containing phosphohydrolase [Actimicrobium sp. CCI2.3]|uniref:HD domain-containing phosphohydrolase n=1 Tax=Actimicrobium sp. CCI2.3 TaxID=3048616 RepID=UPI002AB5C85A|nr:HD domain-containing phosphohydrolase [Actimicrobium sp. CCI2.3]MDY7573003.1 response regulator [Actimicrobium sp. CCI2.3]MEB0023876.1 response regulator [Actimicrobium sp. CCI2.3]